MNKIRLTHHSRGNKARGFATLLKPCCFLSWRNPIVIFTLITGYIVTIRSILVSNLDTYNVLQQNTDPISNQENHDEDMHQKMQQRVQDPPLLKHDHAHDHAHNHAHGSKSHVTRKSKSPKTTFFNNTLETACEYPSSDENESNNNNKCGQLEFPLNITSDNVPKECRPTLALIPSFPTSGNSIARFLFQDSTGLATGSVYEREGREDDRRSIKGSVTLPIMDWSFGRNKFYAKGSVVCKDNLKLPHSGHVALVKTHSPFNNHFNLHEDDDDDQQLNADNHPSYIVRLARNPGDHLLRNTARWRGRDRNNDNYDKFKNTAKKHCSSVITQTIGGAKAWNDFHISYEEGAKRHNIPTIILKYEHLTDPNLSKKKLREVLDFLGEEVRYDINHEEKLKASSYEHGTLFRDLCVGLRWQGSLMQ